MRNLRGFLAIGLGLISITPPSLAQNDRSPFVQVSSVLPDSQKSQGQRIEGIGSLIELSTQPPNRKSYFILTVGHVSLGTDLSVQTKSGVSLPVLRQLQDVENDLALLEIFPTSLPQNLIPLAQAFATSDGVDLVSPLFPSPNRKKLEQMEMLLGEQLTPIAVDYLDLGDFLSLSRRQAPSLLAVAPWLPRSQWRDESSILKAFTHPLSQDPQKKTHRPHRAYPAGYSGSPVLVASNGGYGGRPAYVISGILNCSFAKADREESQATGRAVLRTLIQQALKSPHDYFTSQNQWQITEGRLVKLGNESVISSDCGPIGNGIVIEGTRPDRRQESLSESRERLDRSRESRSGGQNQEMELSRLKRELKQERDPDLFRSKEKSRLKIDPNRPDF